MFKNFKFERKHIIAGIFALIVIITSLSLIRISYNEGIINSYEALSHPLPERTKIGMFEAAWQKYTGNIPNKFVTHGDAVKAEKAIANAYSFMIGADIILLIAAAGVFVQPMISKKLGK